MSDLNSTTAEYLGSVSKLKSFKNKIKFILPMLILLTVIGVFWWLKLIGITMAGDAFCGLVEHTHTEECYETVLVCTRADAPHVSEDAGSAEASDAETEIQDTETETQAAPVSEKSPDTTEADNEHVHSDTCYEKKLKCGIEEHTHTGSCYSDLDADKESAADWEQTFSSVSADLPPMRRLTAIAATQIGYRESVLNFTADENGTRFGYTRYGEWYGNPYGEWSGMFAAFCLRYAQITEVPVSAGAETMRIEWEKAGIYRGPVGYEPFEGDIAFLDKDKNGTADAVAIILTKENDTLSVIEGDVEGEVVRAAYPVSDGVILGYGMTEKGSSPVKIGEGNVQTYLDGVSAQALQTVAHTISYSASILTGGSNFVIYTYSGADAYAFDGNGRAVRIYIDAQGQITADVTDPNILLWSFSSSGGTNSYLIRNVSTGKYMHAFPNNGSGVTTTGAYPSVMHPQADGTVKIKSNSEFAMLNSAKDSFVMTRTEASAAKYSFGISGRCTVWFDGTCGGLMTYSGSPDNGYVAEIGSVMKLPSTWQSPPKYDYVIKGWYDIVGKKYYAPGAEVKITGNTVFYPDWVAASYDVGHFNSDAINTVSSSEFVTVHVFDYNALFNLLSETVSVDISSTGHTEKWSLLTSGNNPYNGEPTLGFIFRDWDRGNEDISYPQNHNAVNNPTNSGSVYSGLYNDRLGELLFGTDNSFDPVSGTGVIGKQYLGEGDGLFRLMTDPSDEHYGYYYYDSDRNAASYNQSEGRFYVYDYLECTKDSATSNDAVGKYSDFLPLNSPYANTNGNNVTTYTYNGTHGEYEGTTHYMYDAKYSDQNNSPDNVGANFWFGMSVDVDFYLPRSPGYKEADGSWGNQDLWGKDLHFKFSGDDDVWVFVDGELVLDLGGIHGVESGDVNFSSGIVTVNGTQTRTLYDIEPGEHVLTIYYLERGSSRSNCAIYYNLAPRFSLDIQKEDVLSGEILDGAEFAVFEDIDCTLPVELWTSKEAHERGDAPTNVFTVTDGSAKMWGLSPGITYYIKETKPPGAEGYSRARGIICLYIDKRVISSSTVEIAPEWDVVNGEPISVSPGFTVHGFRIEDETQSAFIRITNAQDWVVETTTVAVNKKWNDTLDHTYDSVTVYLTVKDPNGTVRRIREIELSDLNNWEYVWTSLPKYGPDMVTPIDYGVEEAYKSGYGVKVEKLEQITIEKTTWAESLMFENGKQYILKTSSGYLSAVSSSSDTFCYVDEETAKGSVLAKWTALVSSGKVKLTNGAGQSITFNNSWNNRYYYLSKSGGNQSLSYSDTGNGLRLYYSSGWTSYYAGAIAANGRLQSVTNTGSALTFIPMTSVTEITVEAVKDHHFMITNTPLDVETSLKVDKVWDIGMASPDIYERAQVTVKLYADGKDTGRTVTLSLKNGWSDTFLGLPYENEDGSVIEYTVVESWETDDWLARYSEIRYIPGTPGSYEITVTNVYRWGRGYELPSTGGGGYHLWVLSGAAIMLASLVSGMVLRRRRKGGKAD